MGIFVKAVHAPPVISPVAVSVGHCHRQRSWQPSGPRGHAAYGGSEKLPPIVR